MDASYPPGLSIVIPTEGRIELTAVLLRALGQLRKTFAPPTEVLVVDSSIGEAREAIAGSCRENDATLVPGPPNVRVKRNLGVAQARYALVLFVDSDCRPAPGLLEQHWHHYTAPQGERPGGVLGQVIFEGPMHWTWNLVRHSSLVQRFSAMEQGTQVSWGPTANLSIRHEVLDRVGPFDSQMPFHLGGDDLDLTYRMVRSGYPLICDPAAAVFHSRETWSSLDAILQRAFRWGRMEFHLGQKHPEAKVPAPPPYWGWWLLVGMLALSQVVLFGRALPLLGWAGWVVLSLLFFAFLVAMDGGGRAAERASRYWDSLLTAVPELTYQLGTAYESMRHRDMSFLWSRCWFNANTARQEWVPEAWNIWSNLTALLVVQSLLLTRLL